MNCWKILGIASTSDKEVIKSAYRTLVKKYHPDLAKTPEKIRTNTVKCAEINSAYQRALLEAENMKDAENIISVTESIPNSKKEKSIKSTFVDIVTIISALLLFGLIIIGVSTLVDLSKSSEVFAVIIGVILISFVMALVSAMISSTTALIALFVERFLLTQFIHRRYFNKLIWIIVVILNTTIALTKMIPFEILNNEINNTILFVVIWNIWPLIFLISWIRTFIKYKSIKDKSFLETLG